MNIVDSPRLVVGGVDTHLDTHVAAVVDSNGGVLAVETFPVTAVGYTALSSWMAGFGTVQRVGIEGTGAYGIGLARHFGSLEVPVITEREAAHHPEFIERHHDRNRLAAEAPGRLVTGGHHAIRPHEADITDIIDARTAATGRLHDHSICETSDGVPVPPETIRRALCNGRLTPVILGTDSIPINVGRTQRTANRAQRRALRTTYRTCAFDRCDIAFDRCEIHHINWFEHGGRTDIANLLPLCTRHHHLVHEGRWTLHLTPDRTLTIRRPDSETHTTSRPHMLDQHGHDRQRAAA